MHDSCLCYSVSVCLVTGMCVCDKCVCVCDVCDRCVCVTGVCHCVCLYICVTGVCVNV